VGTDLPSILRAPIENPRAGADPSQTTVSIRPALPQPWWSIQSAFTGNPRAGADLPLYLLFLGGRPKTFRGNAALASITETVVANRFEALQPSEHGPRVWITGQGTAQDFDAALLTMDLKWSAHPCEESRICTEGEYILNSTRADSTSDERTREDVLHKLIGDLDRYDRGDLKPFAIGSEAIRERRSRTGCDVPRRAVDCCHLVQ
jgi:hypothetical protein